MAALGLVFIAGMTLVPRPGQGPLSATSPVWCLICGHLGMVDVVLNVILFLPLGFGLRLAGLSWFRTVLAALAITVGVELLQLDIVAGRDSSLSDLLTNTTGAAIGAWTAVTWRRWAFPSPAAARRLTMGWAAGWLAVLCFTAWAQQPALPSTTYYGQWAAMLPHLGHYEGIVLSAAVTGTPIGEGRIAWSEALRRRMVAGPVTVDVVTAPDDDVRELAPIFSIYDERQNEILLLGQDGWDLIYRVRTRTHDLRLRPPAIRLSDVFRGIRHDTVRVYGSFDGRRYTVGIRTEDGETRRTLAVSPAWGWSMLLPFAHYAFGPGIHFLTALWLAGLVLPLGYWSWQPPPAPRSRFGRLTLPVAVVVLGLGAVAPAFGLLPLPWWAWIAAGLGLLAGRRLRIAASVARARRAAARREARDRYDVTDRSESEVW